MECIIHFLQIGLETAFGYTQHIQTFVFYNDHTQACHLLRCQMPISVIFLREFYKCTVNGILRFFFVFQNFQSYIIHGAVILLINLPKLQFCVFVTKPAYQ